MNRIKTLVPFFFILILLLGFIEKSDKKQSSTLTVIMGYVSNLDVYPDKREFTVNILDYRGKKTIFRDSIKSDGTFKIEFDLYKTQDIYVAPLVREIIAHPGDTIILNIDFKDIGNIQFSGDGEKTNRDLNNYLSSNFAVFSFDNRESREMSLQAYKSYCDSVKSLAFEKQHEFVTDYNPTSEVISWTKDYINIMYQQSLLMFPMIVAYNSNVKYPDLDIPNDYFSFLENIETNFSDSIINTHIYELLNAYSGTISNRTIRDSTLTHDIHLKMLMNEFIDNHTESFFKQMLIGSIFYQKLNHNDLDFFENYTSVLEDEIHESAIKTPLTHYYEELKRQISNTQIHSDEILAKLNDTPGKALMDTILSQNKGKVIYIDFWATWCGPCIAEMPNSKKLKQKLAGQDIEFVYICLDANEKRWKLLLSQMQLDGKHYLCDEEQSKSITRAFEINGIPDYTLINKSGHIVESGSYLRPGSPETIIKIEKLLHEREK